MPEKLIKKNGYYYHKSSFIDENPNIGNETKIWHFSHICSGAKIGKKCIIGQNTYIGNEVIIGNNVKIQNNVSIYNGVEIKDNVFIDSSVVFTNISIPRSLKNQKKNFKLTIIEEGSTIGANATIVCGNLLGKFCFIGPGTIINKNVSDYALMVGNPGKQIGWVSERGNRLNLPINGDSYARCQYTNKIYQLINGIVKIIK